MKKYIFLLVASLFVCKGFAQNIEDDKKWNTILTEVTENKSFKVDVRQVLPRRGKTIHPTSPYSIEVKNDSLISYLPYFGRATTIAYGGGDGLNFTAPIKSYDSKILKKQRVRVTLKADSEDDHYRYIITFYKNGNVSLDVIGINRESISFLGDFVFNIDKEK